MIELNLLAISFAVLAGGAVGLGAHIDREPRAHYRQFCREVLKPHVENDWKPGDPIPPYHMPAEFPKLLRAAKRCYLVGAMFVIACLSLI